LTRQNQQTNMQKNKVKTKWYLQIKTAQQSVQRAPDKWDSAAFSVVFSLRVFSALKQSPRPPQRHASRTQTVGRSTKVHGVQNKLSSRRVFLHNSRKDEKA